MDALFEIMSRQHGVATRRQASAIGVDKHSLGRLVERGVLRTPASGVLVASAAPPTWEQRALVASLAPGDAVISHGAAARLHGLDGFDRYTDVDVLCRKGWWPGAPEGTIRHFTRGVVADDIVVVRGIRVLSVAATLTLLSPSAGLGPTAKALDSALRLGHTIADLRAVGTRWRRRGRAGPPTLLLLLDERDGKTLPRSFFQRLAKAMFARHRIRLFDEYPVRDERGILLAELDLAEPSRKVGVECQSWDWHATPEAQYRDARRKGTLRRLGWDIIDVWWRDLARPGPIVAELEHLLTTKPACSSVLSASRDG